jgi:RimJ/RimL family protein N-acetyltransferase
MICELEPEHYGKVGPLFDGWAFNLRIHSLLGGYSRGKVYVDDAEKPGTAIVWIKDLFYLAGDATIRAFGEALDEWIHETAIPLAKEVGVGYFAVQVCPHGQWAAKIGDLLQRRKLQVNREWKFAFSAERYRRQRGAGALAPGFTLQRVDRRLLDDPACAAMRNSVEWFCDSVDRFLERGLGYCVRHGQELVSSCLSEYVHDTTHEIAINTYDPGYRRQGFATSAAYAYVEHCIASGWTPVWSADETNAASIAMAAKLGFHKVGECPDLNFYFA